MDCRGLRLRDDGRWYLANPEWVANVQSGAYRDWVQTQYANNETS
jgi:dTDP-glucose 4,6-dehydratase